MFGGNKATLSARLAGEPGAPAKVGRSAQSNRGDLVRRQYQANPQIDGQTCNEARKLHGTGQPGTLS
ncbi:hypothetical protein D3C75_1297970 [compost metagenome]